MPGLRLNISHKDLEVRGVKLRETIKKLAEEAEKTNLGLWLRRKDQKWGRKLS